MSQNTQRGKKMISIYKIEKIKASRFMSSVKMYKNLNTVCRKPEDLTFIINIHLINKKNIGKKISYI